MTIDIVTCTNVSPAERADMYSVFARYYDNVSPSRFYSDLDEKSWVIHLRDEDKRLVGFSTLQVYEHLGLSGTAMILYSGDTIIDRAYRRKANLAGAFGHILLKVIKDYPDVPVYWLLTSKGASTYRFMPVFFKTFYPVFDQQTPAPIKLLMDQVALKKFGTAYSEDSQVVAHNRERDWLCASEHDPMLLRRTDSHICFFLQRNPGYVKGDELVCIAEISESNLNAKAWRAIKHTEVCWRE